jgi:ParB family chromosome partitioning protein
MSFVHIIDGDEEAQAELIEVAGTHQFEHRVAQLRAERKDRRRHAEAAAAYTAKGYTVLDQRPGWYDKTYIPAHNLKDASGQPLTDERVAELDAQHWAVWLDSTEAYVDAQTGEPVDEDLIDFDTADDPQPGSRRGVPPLPHGQRDHRVAAQLLLLRSGRRRGDVA